MQKVNLYQKNSNGKVKEWSVEVVDNGNNTSDIVVTTGLIDGKKQEVRTTIYSGMNIGKANETNHYTQAVSQAESDIKSKIKKGYSTDINNLKESDERAGDIKAVMKGGQYHPLGKEKQSSAKTLDELKIRDKEVALQVKMDGLRCQIHVTRTGAKFYTSSTDPMYVFPHIAQSVIKSFNKIFDYVNSKYGVEDYILDGEIYSHKLPFEKISGLVRKKHRTLQDLMDEQLLQFHIFDVVLDVGYSTRYKLLDYFVDPGNVEKVECNFVTANEEVIDEEFKKFLNQGYEGLMIRLLDIPYEHKRGKQLLKYKPFLEEEFMIVGYKKSITGDTLGSIEFMMNDGSERTFYATGDGFSDADCLDLWNNRHKNIGKYMTVKFLEYTEQGKGVPRHGKFKAFRKGPSKD